MTSPRSQLVDPTTPGYYHCISRCVRRAWLCGVDSYTGESYEHRRQWVEDRIFELAEIFALGVYAYAVMSNHLHIVVRLDPALAWSWSAEEVARYDLGHPSFARSTMGGCLPDIDQGSKSSV